MKKRDVYVIVIIATIAIITSAITIMIYGMRRSKVAIKDGNEFQFNNITTISEITNNIYNEEIKTTNYSEEKVSPNAIITFYKYYKDCQHTVKKRENVSKEMVNKTEEDFSNMYSDWEIKKFTSNEIELYKEFQGECDEHYLIKENEGVIGIFRLDDSGNERLVENTDIALNYLPEQDVVKIKDGIKIYGKEKLNAYLEDFE